ncbi:hypothetical protein K490DRAFT_65894 [Saccharata proteae CBS 121410]|uniref:Steroid 5-alpha reductase C-terminal domain-containing protein n=1 Tax=Saccharata proteae CBS 121410 TaxID=1314787 RepID=A0A9P4HW21_9PEZI|nr:hypothetical protein K490DRAFT_65894 [Saccharata proteae CBS 121410]
MVDFSWVKERRLDLIDRGSYKSTPIGTSLFVGLRALDPLLQYGILAHGVGSDLLHKMGLQTLPPGLPIQTGISLIDNLGLSPYRLILLAMSVGSMLKQNYWLLFVSREEMPAHAAIKVSIFNTLCNSLNNLAFTTALLSASVSSDATFPQYPLIVGSAMFIVGMGLEWISEIQRANFKKDPKNAGKPCTGGLWKLARHINYGGYSLWRGGFAMACMGWTAGAFATGFFMWDFATRAVIVLDEYCSKRYGEDWANFKEQTPYKLLPFIY